MNENETELIVKLSSDEALACVNVASIQMLRVIQNDMKEEYVKREFERDEKTKWADRIMGAMAECAVCKYYNLFWSSGIAGVGEGSDMYGIEIRSTTVESGHLIIKDTDIEKHGDHPFILVVCNWPNFRICGWLYGKEAENQDWLRPTQKPPAYWVPQRELYPMNILPGITNQNDHTK